MSHLTSIPIYRFQNILVHKPNISISRFLKNTKVNILNLPRQRRRKMGFALKAIFQGSPGKHTNIQISEYTSKQTQYPDFCKTWKVNVLKLPRQRRRKMGFAVKAMFQGSPGKHTNIQVFSWSNIPIYLFPWVIYQYTNFNLPIYLLFYQYTIYRFRWSDALLVRWCVQPASLNYTLSIIREPWTLSEHVFCTLLPRGLVKWNALQS